MADTGWMGKPAEEMVAVEPMMCPVCDSDLGIVMVRATGEYMFACHGCKATTPALTQDDKVIKIQVTDRVQ